jgi:hypothetical protein
MVYVFFPFRRRSITPEPFYSIRPMETEAVGRLSCAMGRARRLEDKIRLLCAKAAIADGEQDLHKILSDLRNALHQHAHKVRMFTASALLAKPGVKHDKRNRDVPPTGRV